MIAMMNMLDIKIVLLLYGAAASASFLSGLVIFFAEWLPFLVVAMAIAYKIFSHAGEKFFRPLALLVLSPIVALAIAEGYKLLVPSSRPFADGLGMTPLISVSDPFGSFPSAHAAFFGALGATIFLQNKGIGKWYLGAALVIGISRVATGVHFPSDVIAGLMLGVLVSIFQNMCHRIKINMQLQQGH